MEQNVAKRVPYGIQDFVQVIEQNCYYVDKTAYIPKLEEKIKNIGKKPEPVQEKPSVTKTEEPIVEEVNLQEEEQLVAVITAAIMASYGSNAQSADKLVVRSIHRVDGRRA